MGRERDDCASVLQPQSHLLNRDPWDKPGDGRMDRSPLYPPTLRQNPPRPHAPTRDLSNTPPRAPKLARCHKHNHNQTGLDPLARPVVGQAPCCAWLRCLCPTPSGGSGPLLLSPRPCARKNQTQHQRLIPPYPKGKHHTLPKRSPLHTPKTSFRANRSADPEPSRRRNAMDEFRAHRFLIACITPHMAE